MNSVVYRECDVLVVGAGLAGYRAGLSALGKSRDLTVRLATLSRGPSGSSFTNSNNALGMIVCRTPDERQAFIRKALAIAPPGIIVPELVATLADDSEYLFRELVQTGLAFKKDAHHDIRRYSACFLSDPPMAYIFEGLPAACFLMNRKFYKKGGKVWEGLSLLDVLTHDEGRVIGAVFEEMSTGQIWAVRCQSLVMATGGAAGLFPRSLTDPGNLGISLPLMELAGATLVNMNYVQFMWYRHDPWQPWSISTICHPDIRVIQHEDQSSCVPPSIRGLGNDRGNHAPVGHGRKDSALDDFLCRSADEDRVSRIQMGDDIIKVALYAHAQNGGVLIDTMARTGVPGLFACGECAAGMHGANRVGGAMILSTQVFGHRAGVSAARFAHDPEPETRRIFMDRVRQRPCMNTGDPHERQRGLFRLKSVLKGSEGPYPRPGLNQRLSALSIMREYAIDWRLKQALDCARLIIGNDEPT